MVVLEWSGPRLASLTSLCVRKLFLLFARVTVVVLSCLFCLFPMFLGALCLPATDQAVVLSRCSSSIMARESLMSRCYA
jgi:hypothetical protein